jgi:hypothetical protein
VFVALLVLIIRQLLIIMLIILAPVALVAFVLPNTQGAYKVWWQSFSKALLMFPIIAGFIAAGRVFALVSQVSGTTGSSFMAFIAYFAPYFLLPMTFRFAGGALGALGGFVNDRHRGAFDRIKGFRGRQLQQNMHNMATGSRFQDRGVLSRGFNRTTAGIATGTRGRFGVGARGREAMALRQSAAGDEALKNNSALQQLTLNDDEATAVLALSGGSERGAREAARDLFGADTARANRALAAASAVGFNRQNASGALTGMAQNKSRAIADGDMETVNRGIARLANGNASIANNSRGNFQYHSRNAGRFDLGDNTMEAAWNRTNPYQLASSGTPHAMRAFADHWTGEYQEGAEMYRSAAAAHAEAETRGDVGAQQAAREVMQASAQRMQTAQTARIEMEGMKSSATAENAQIINAATMEMDDAQRVLHGQMQDNHGALPPDQAGPLQPEGSHAGSIERDLRNVEGQARANARAPERFDPNRIGP